MYFWYHGQKINFTEAAQWQYRIYTIYLFCSNSTFQPASYQDNICRLLSVKIIQTCQKLSSQNGVQEIYSPTTEYGVSFMIPCTTFLHQFFDEYNNTKIYSNQKFSHYIIGYFPSGHVKILCIWGEGNVNNLKEINSSQRLHTRNSNGIKIVHEKFNDSLRNSNTLSSRSRRYQTLIR